MVIKKLAVYLVLSLIFVLPAFGWNYQTHEVIAESAYYFIAEETQSKLNLTLLRLGAITPDKYFHDYINHHYPISFYKAVYWLEMTTDSYNQGNYNKASYAFGIASHYISDSFSAPHYIKNEASKLHLEYENQALEPSTSTRIRFACDKPAAIDLNQSLYYASREAGTWQRWVETKDPGIPQNAISKATALVNQIALETFDTSCSKNETVVIKEPIISFGKVALLGLILLLIFLVLIAKPKRLSKLSKD